MAIQPLCNMCGIELDDFGGILLSPPDGGGMVKKYHLCKACFDKTEDQLKK
jgi:hypothetical protein